MPFVVRLPLLHERGHALFGVLALEQLDEQLAFQLESFVETHPEALHDGLLDAPDRVRGTGGVGANARERLVEKLGPGDDLVHDACLERVLRRQRRPAQHEIESLLAPDKSRETLRAAGPWEKAERDLRKTDAIRALGGDAEIAAERHLETPAETVSVDRGHDHLRRALEFVHRL